MPIFEYNCSSCGNQFEDIRSVEEADLAECPKCGESGAERKMSTFFAGVSIKNEKEIPCAPCAGQGARA